MKTPTFWQFVVGLFLVATLAGCTAVPAATPGEENSASLPKQTAVPALSPVTPTAKATPAATKDTAGSADSQDQTSQSKPELAMGDAVLVFQRTGGLMGIGSNDQTWYFYADGRVTVSDGRSWQVKPAEITTLVDDLLALGFAGMGPDYLPADTCCDRFTYTIAIRDGEAIYQTTTMDGADAPPELFQAIDRINQFILTLPT